MRKYIVFFTFLMSIQIILSQDIEVEHKFDNLNRLKKVEYENGASITYEYDKVGNRASKVTLPEKGLLSLIDEYLNEVITVFPNATTDVINIMISEDVDLQKIQLYTLGGQLLAEQKEFISTISMRKYASGIYLLHIKSAQGEVTKKIIKE